MTSASAAEHTGRRRRAASAYDRATRTAGLVVGLLLMATLWLVGGYYTLAWLAERGLRLAAAGLVPINVLLSLGAPSTSPAPHWLAVVGAWCLPVALSAAEIGLWPRRVRHPLAWGLWLGFLLVDALTTAAGVALFIETDPTTAWLIGLVVGVALALIPEKAARTLWQLLREDWQ